MQKVVQKFDESVVRQKYPLAGLADGWYFRVEELSASHYIVQGVDLWGRSVNYSGNDPKSLLQDAVQFAVDTTAGNVPKSEA